MGTNCSRRMFAAKSIHDTAHGQTVICREVFAGHLLSSTSEKKEKVQQMNTTYRVRSVSYEPSFSPFSSQGKNEDP